MKKENLKKLKFINSQGLTLLELILAMSMFAIILFGGTRLESSAVRLTAGNYEAEGLQNELGYAYRILEKDFVSPKLVKIIQMPEPLAAPKVITHLYQWDIRPYEAKTDGSEDIHYVLDLIPGHKKFQRTVKGVTEDLISSDALGVGPLKYPDPPNNRLAFWTDPTMKLITINLALESLNVKHGMKSQPGYARSFLIRTGTVQDCRSGPC